MGGRLGPWLGVCIGSMALIQSACLGGAGAPRTPTPAPTVLQLPTVPRPALDTPGVQAAASPSSVVTHTVQPGETLGSIALRYYGDANSWQRILDANRATVPDQSALAVGTQLTIPPATNPPSASTPPTASTPPSASTPATR
jgi:nucleoid-associated protein YgaU